MEIIMKKCKEHPFFKRFKANSILIRIRELCKYFNLQPKIREKKTYNNKYDRIKGYIIRNSKYMSKRRGIEFTVTMDDFELPELCPILGIKLEYGAGNDGNSPNHATLDRIDNTKGYIPGNIMVISRLANAMKNQANYEELENFIKNYSLLLNYVKEHGTLGNVTDIFPH